MSWPGVRLRLSQVSEFYQNGGTNRAGFAHESFLRLTLRCLIIRKFGYLWELPSETVQTFCTNRRPKIVERYGKIKQSNW